MTDAKLSAIEIEQARWVLHAGGGRTLLEAAANYVFPVFWGRRSLPEGGRILHNGSAFLLEVDGPTILVTADHVIRRLEADAALYGADLFVQVGNEDWAWQNAVIDRDATLDLATFRTDARLVSKLGKWVYRRSLGMWPPPPPEQGKGVFFAGFPSIYRSENSPQQLDFGIYGGLFPATVVGDTDIVCQIERQFIETLSGFGGPPPNAWLGGMSGSPAWALTAVGWRLAGILHEYSTDFELFYFKRPDFIRPDGTLDH